MRKPKGLGVREIAAKLHVSISTVSRAMNNDSRISEETIANVLKTANEMGYHQKKSRKTIAIILPESHLSLGWYSLNMLNALIKVLRGKEYFWEFINADKTDILQERSLSGLISVDFNQSVAQEISRKYQISLVCVNNKSCHYENVFSVNSDASSAISLSFEHLYNFGHRKIAFLSGSSVSFPGEKRKTAFLKICEEYKISKDCICLSSKGAALYGKILDLYKSGVTGIIAAGESESLSVLNALKYCKISVPRKMSLITWETPLVSEFMDPPITTVGQNFEALAENAVEMLELSMNRKTVPNDVLVPYHLHLRSSVALPPK